MFALRKYLSYETLNQKQITNTRCSLFWGVKLHGLVASFGRFGNTYRSHLQVHSRWERQVFPKPRQLPIYVAQHPRTTEIPHRSGSHSHAPLRFCSKHQTVHHTLRFTHNKYTSDSRTAVAQWLKCGLQTGRSLARSQLVSLNFSLKKILPIAL